MSSHNLASDGNVEPEEGRYSFAFFHGSVQQGRGLSSDNEGVRLLAQNAMALYLSKATVEGKTSWEGNQTIYGHTAESRGIRAGVATYHWHSSKGDPMVIPTSFRVTHLDRYWGCTYVHSKEGSYAHIPGLRSGLCCHQLDTPSEFVDAIMLRLGRSVRPVNSRVCFF